MERRRSGYPGRLMAGVLLAAALVCGALFFTEMSTRSGHMQTYGPVSSGNSKSVSAGTGLPGRSGSGASLLQHVDRVSAAAGPRAVSRMYYGQPGAAQGVRTPKRAQAGTGPGSGLEAVQTGPGVLSDAVTLSAAGSEGASGVEAESAAVSPSVAEPDASAGEKRDVTGWFVLMIVCAVAAVVCGVVLMRRLRSLMGPVREDPPDR